MQLRIPLVELTAAIRFLCFALPNLMVNPPTRYI